MHGRCERGAAVVEGVLMIPILLLLLFLVLHVHRTRGAALRVTARARACALEYALHGCKTVPAGCEGALGVERGAREDAVVSEVSEETRKELRAVESVNSSMGEISSFPVVGDAITGLFGERVRAADSTRVEVHVPGARGDAEVTGRYVVACNVQPRRGRGVARELFDAVFD